MSRSPPPSSFDSNFTAVACCHWPVWRLPRSFGLARPYSSRFCSPKDKSLCISLERWTGAGAMSSAVDVLLTARCQPSTTARSSLGPLIRSQSCDHRAGSLALRHQKATGRLWSLSVPCCEPFPTKTSHNTISRGPNYGLVLAWARELFLSRPLVRPMRYPSVWPER